MGLESMRLVSMRGMSGVMVMVAAAVAASAHAGPAEHAKCEILMPDNVGLGGYVPNLWPNGVVVYEFSSNVSSFNQQKVLNAMEVLEQPSNITFIERTNESNYVFIQSGNSNSSFVGMIGGAQPLNMVSWNSSGEDGVNYIIVHELMHALGLWHEQSRPDRDNYVQIVWSNIPGGVQHNFQIQNQAILTDTPYDFESVMHYSQCAFTECGACAPGCETITVLPPNEQWQGQIGQRDFLSGFDAAGLADMYGVIQHAVPGDYDTIQAAIDAASDAHEILVAPGTYHETINFNGKAITLKSTAGPAATVIDGQQAGPVVTCETDEGPAAVLDGFTITGGESPVGAGMFNSGASPTITNCRFVGNTAMFNGGAMYNKDASNPDIVNCTFENNTAGLRGGAIHNPFGSPTITNCDFSNNDADLEGGAIFTNDGSAVIENSTFCDSSPQHIAGNWSDAGDNCFSDTCDDVNGNDLPDGCECLADIAGNDDSVSVTDLLTLLSQWGACGACDADLNGDQQVNVTDLLTLLGSWGPCS